MEKSNQRYLNYFLLASVFTINVLAGFLFFRWDLTSEKRHSLTDDTKTLIEELNDVVFVSVYLEGELPAEFARLKNGVKEKLDEMRAYTTNIQYEFINPSESELASERNAVYQQLVDDGLTPTTIPIREKDGVSEKIIFPGAILRIGDKTVPLQLLKSQEMIPSQAMINKSITNLEYFISTSIKRATRAKDPAIGFTRGHGESMPLKLEDIAGELDDQYVVKYVPLTEKLNSLFGYDVIVISNPTIPFTEKEKFVLDQYIMRGGKAVFLVQSMDVHLDSLKGNTQKVALAQNLNLDDLFFKYGVRVNRDVILDQNCGPIVVNVGTYGNKPKLEPFPWFYHPVMVPQGAHPILINVDPVLTQFPASLDTIGIKDIKKTILLGSSPYNKRLRSPVRVSINTVGLPPDFTDTKSDLKPMAVLLEGRFNSLFTNRIPEKIVNDTNIRYLEKGLASKILVIADGNFIENPVDTLKKTYFPLGFDTQVAKRPIFGNKEFFLNAINYLVGDNELISVRSREIKVRKLDADKLVNQKSRYQSINLIFPLVFLVLLGIVNFLIRKRKYGQ